MSVKLSPSRSHVAEPAALKDGAEVEYNVENVGLRLRELRKQKGLTINGLAKLARVPASTISKIENGLLKPSLVHAINLAHALDENLGFLVDHYRSQPQRTTFVYGGSRNEIDYPEMSMSLQDLNGPFIAGILEARLGSLRPGAHSGVAPMTHRGEELCYVLKGAIRYTIEGEEWTLGPGDSMQFKSTLKHRWQNAYRGTTQVIWIFSDSGGLKF
jgi:transcriptional regulator with XRE-family HTH domain